jgi:RNase P subunit RPR2
MIVCNKCAKVITEDSIELGLDGEQILIQVTCTGCGKTWFRYLEMEELEEA